MGVRGHASADESGHGHSLLVLHLIKSVLSHRPCRHRWMERFPSIASLSESSSEEVNRLWAGLGYYSRAQRLLQGAKVIMNEHGGNLPDTVSKLKTIPGIGPYTAGAIASIAFEKREPLVDGNVVRVLSRLRAIRTETGPKLEKICWEMAAEVVDPTSPSTFNQALMELGAVICKPTSPLCESCPVRSLCIAKAMVDDPKYPILSKTTNDHPRNVTFFPVKSEKKKPKELLFIVGVFSWKDGADERFLFTKRPNKGLLAGQWEFPCVEVDLIPLNQDGKCEAMDLWRSFPPYLEQNFRIFVSNSSGGISDHSQGQEVYIHGYQDTVQQISHVFSHQIHRMHVISCSVSMTDITDASSNQRYRWMTAAEIIELGITSGCKKILDSISNEVEPSERISAKRKRCKDIGGEKDNHLIEQFFIRKKA